MKSVANPACKSRTRQGFSMIELLVVITVMSILVALGTPSLLTSRRANALTSAGNRFVDTLALARQAAASRNTVTCLILVDGDSSVERRQVVGVLEFDQASSQWKPLVSWVRMPEATRIVDLGTSDDLVTSENTAIALAPLNFEVRGKIPEAGSYSTVLFYPEGSIATGNAFSRRFSARAIEDEANATPANFYDVVINTDTSAYHVVRP